jgi:signal transduction histidine kinase
MDPKVEINSELEQLYAISHIAVHASEIKTALDKIALRLRSLFIFDNIVLYRSTQDEQIVEVEFARAMGRGRKTGIDIAWGESLGRQIVEERTVILENPDDREDDRLRRPYMLGIPIIQGRQCLGALIFIRFGGPAFIPENFRVAEFVAQQICILLNRDVLNHEAFNLQKQYKQIQLQEDFVSTISHELRSPLGFIKGYTTTLLRDDTSWDPETQLEFLHIIDQETDHLKELIDNLLDSARMQSGQLRMEFQPVRLDSVINDIIARNTKAHPDLKVIINTNAVMEPVWGDPNRLAQVFENLISNAIKYAPGAPVYIRIKQDGGITRIEVEDRGPGIATQHLPFIFERFYRMPGISPSLHGSGLGLFICRQIIQAHMGEITAESTMGKGTTFHILLRKPPTPSMDPQTSEEVPV